MMINSKALLLCLLCSAPALAMLPNPPVANVATVANTQLSFGTPQQAPQPPLREIALDTSNQTVRTILNAYLVEQQGAQEALTPIAQNTRLKSGDIVEYRAYYTNQSGERIRSMKALLEIPQGVELIGGVHPQAAFATIDGQRFVRTPIRGQINGQVQEVPLNLYKALRWEVEDVGINGTALVKFRARIK